MLNFVAASFGYTPQHGLSIHSACLGSLRVFVAPGRHMYCRRGNSCENLAAIWQQVRRRIWSRTHPRRGSCRRNRFEDGSKALPACYLLLHAMPGENEIGEFVPHGGPGEPTAVHSFAADFAARPRRATRIYGHAEGVAEQRRGRRMTWRRVARDRTDQLIKSLLVGGLWTSAESCCNLKTADPATVLSADVCSFPPTWLSTWLSNPIASYSTLSERKD
jgi:hypothetical protein